MKRLFIILIALQVLSGNHFLPELLKLPQLVQHFNEHRMENNGISLLDFLTLHYFNAEHQEKDKTRHKSLPLKSDNCAHHDMMKMRFLAPPSVSEPVEVIFSTKTKPAIIENPFFDSKIRFSVFQPPRV